MKNDWQIIQLLFCPKIISEEDLNKSFKNKVKKTEVSIEVYKKLLTEIQQRE